MSFSPAQACISFYCNLPTSYSPNHIFPAGLLEPDSNSKIAFSTASGFEALRKCSPIYRLVEARKRRKKLTSFDDCHLCVRTIDEQLDLLLSISD